MFSLPLPDQLKIMGSYEDTENFRCCAFEANPSTSTNIHVLEALKRIKLEPNHASVAKIITFLQNNQQKSGFWIDKWHISPFYPTCHAVIACAGYYPGMVKQSVKWILDQQHPSGGWGFYGQPTLEETAYAVQALCIWQSESGHILREPIKRGAAWLKMAKEQPEYPTMWIGKCLYAPIHVISSAIESARLLSVNI
jgi:halimadienyl-diphosphate synthase